MLDLFLLNAGFFPFSLSEMLWDTCISKYLHQDSNLEVSSNRGGFESFLHKLTHHPYLDGHLGQFGTRNRPQFYKIGLLPSPPLTPSTQCYLFVILMETHKVSSSIGGLTFTTQFMTWTGSFRTVIVRARPLNGFENGPNLAEKILFANDLTRKFHLFLCEPGSARFAKVTIKGGPEPSKQIIQKVLFPIGRFHFKIIPVPKQILPYHPTRCISRPAWSVCRSAGR